MKLLLSPMGTTGDIRPFIALGVSLKRQGAEVLMAVPVNGEELCKKFNLPYTLIDFDYRQMLKLLETKPPLKELIAMLEREMGAPFATLKDFAPGMDFLLGNARNYALPAISEATSVPYRQVWHIPQVFQSKFITPWRFTRHDNPPWLNSLLWKIHNFKENRVGDRFVNKHRVQVGLSPLKDFTSLQRKNIILAADELLAPVPGDVTADFIRTDYWHLQEDDELDQAILEFINAGEKPLFFSFGSRYDSSGDATVAMVEEVARTQGIRAIIQKGWGGLGKEPSRNILIIDSAPHHRLFPHMAAAIHHGGAGTTHTAALSGIPQVLVPENGDQFYWGHRVKTLGIGTQVPKAKLNFAALNESVSFALTSAVQAEAKSIAAILGQREDMDAIAARLMAQIISGNGTGPA